LLASFSRGCRHAGEGPFDSRSGQVRATQSHAIALAQELNYFLNKFSNAARASLGLTLTGVDVSFSRVTRIS
jgi:hypothetical protein